MEPRFPDHRFIKPFVRQDPKQLDLCARAQQCSLELYGCAPAF
jgi:hypothetical protein